MRLPFNCCDKCFANDAEITMDTSSWTPSQINNDLMNNKEKEGGSLTNTVVTQPTPARGVNISQLDDEDIMSNPTDYVDIDFRTDTLLNDDRFTDMAATIFKRNS